MFAKKKIPQVTIRRLSQYLRCLNSLEVKDVSLVSSKQLGEILHCNPAQVRKDLAYFGEFGKRGVGYSIVKLRDHIIKILGLREKRLVGIVGAGGRLGQALTFYKGFEKRNFKIAALFDKDPQLIDRTIGDLKIFPVDEFPKVAKKLNIEIVILTIPVEAVPEVFEIIQFSNVRGVLNFAPTKLPSADGIFVHNVDMAIELESLSYYLNSHKFDEAVEIPTSSDDTPEA